VLVLHNYGLPFWPRWHYAVVIGYDAASQTVLLRSGTRQRQRLSAAHFMRAWDNADRWALVLLRPGELPAQPALERYLEAATAFERSASPAASRQVFQTAVGRWPDAPVAWVGHGTAHYRMGELRDAAADYSRALALAPELAGARNNLAMTLLELGCPGLARQHLDLIDIGDLPAGMHDAVADTRRQIESRSSTADAATCPALH
jgi:tetratricopeptide (TPR) repeat protein